MSPILVRPVREQLEHDRVIRALQAKYKRRFNVGINPGIEQAAPAGEPATPQYPDLVLTAPGRGRRTIAVVEVETSESVNNLEAMAQWANYARLRADLVLYVPVGSVDAARRLCADHGIPVSEIWTYHALGDQLRFAQVYTAPAGKPASRAGASTASGTPARAKAASARKAAAKPAAKRSAKAPAKRAARPKAATKPKAGAAKVARKK